MNKNIQRTRNIIKFFIFVFAFVFFSSYLVSGEEITLRGNSAVIHFDNFIQGTSEYRYYIIVHNETNQSYEEIYRLNLGQGQDIEISGMDIQISGTLGNTATGEQVIDVDSLEILGSVADSDDVDHSLGEQRVAVLLMDNGNNHDDDDGNQVSVTDVRNLFFNENYDADGDGLSDSAAAWVRKVSYGKAWLSGDVFGYYVSDDVCDYYFNSHLYSIADDDVNFLNYDRIIVFLPSSICNGPGGAGSVGKYYQNTPDGMHSYSSTLINGMDDYTFSVVVHEFGHNLGLSHAGMNTFEVYDEYGDHWDVMGGRVGDVNQYLRHFHHYSGLHKEEIKWLEPNNVKEAIYGTYTIKALELTGSGYKTLKIPAGDVNYYVEYRRSLDYDTIESNEEEDYFDGVFIRTDETRYNDENHITSDSMLIDTTPYSSTLDSALKVGLVFHDYDNEVIIKTISISETSAKVEVSVDCDTHCASITEPSGIPPAIIYSSGQIACNNQKMACDKVQSNCMNTGLENDWQETSATCTTFFTNSNRPSSCLYRAVCNGDMQDSDHTINPPTISDSSLLKKGVVELGPSSQRNYFVDSCVSNIIIKELFVNNGLYDSMQLVCPSGKVCTNGKCERAPTACEDECSNSHGGGRSAGCMGNFFSWDCGEANDGDNCLDKIYSECAVGKICRSLNGGSKIACVAANWRNSNSASTNINLEVECPDCNGNAVFDIFDIYGGEVLDTPLSAVFDNGVASANWNTAGMEGNSYNFITTTNGAMMQSDTLNLPKCGDDILEEGEQCDDGNNLTESCMYGQTSCTVCNSTCNAINGQASYCGDGIVSQPNEQCEDGNTINGDGCNQLCMMEPYYRVFVTNQTWNGDLGGLQGADNKCQQAAFDRGLGGAWRAWVSTPTVWANSTIYHSTKTYRRLDGVIVADNWDDLTDGTLNNPINVNEFGDNISVIRQVWTGTNYLGVARLYHCNNWTSVSSGVNGEVGNRDKIVSTWSNIGVNNCNDKNGLYCFEQPGGGGGPGFGPKGPLHLSVDINNLHDMTA